jgi:hypothetical protein
MSFAGAAGAVPVLCGEVIDGALRQTHCVGSGHKNIRDRIGYVFDAATPSPTWVLLGDWENHQITSGRLELDQHLFSRGHPVDASSGWSFGFVFAHPERWAQPQLVDAAPIRNVPEPGSLALFGIGLIGAALSRRYKRTRD